MPQEDFLKKQIDKLGQVLGKVLTALTGLKMGDDIKNAIEAIDQTLKEQLGLRIHDLTEIPRENFMVTLQENKNLSDNNLEILADILFSLAVETGYQEEDSEENRKLLERSLIILQYLEKESATYSFERNYKIEEIQNILS